MAEEILGDGGDRLLNQFEPGPGGVPATVAYRCPGGRYTLGNGATEWPNGDPVRRGDACTPEQADELTDWSVRKFAAVVDGFITRPMTRNQRDAFILLAYNIGPHAFQFDCSASENFNSGRTNKDVAAAFGRWCKATSSGPEKGDLKDEYYLPIIRVKPGVTTPKDHTDYVWADPDGRPCKYQRAFPGLLRRHLSEACLFLNLDWVQACRKDTVSIVSQRVWDPVDKRWEDRVRTKTELADVLPTAQRYPLAAPTEPAHAQTPVLVPTEPARIEAPRAGFPDSSAAIPLDGIPVNLPLPDPAEDELFLDTPAAPATDAKGSPPVSEPPSPSSQAAVPASNPDPANKDQPRVSAEAAPAKAPPSPPAPPVPLPPKLPDPPIPIGQQTSAVESAKKSEDWSASAKAMWQSRRFWGLVLVMGGRLWMLKTGSNVVLGAVSDPLVTEMFSGFMVMLIGEIIQHWGERKATRPLR